MSSLISTLLHRRLHPNSSPADHSDSILRQILSSFESDDRFDLQSYPINVALVDDEVVLEGEVKDIIVKKLAFDIATRLSDSTRVVDRLRVKPAEHIDDVAIRDGFIKSMMEEPDLKRCLIHSRLPNMLEIHRKFIVQPSGSIVAEVANGIVTLNGEVSSLAQKRLAGVLAWWAPGCRDVVNGLEIVPAKNDSDDEISCAVRRALEKDPLINATTICVSTKDSVVTLAGLVSSEVMRLRTECDCWYVVGVKKVINQLDVKS